MIYSRGVDNAGRIVRQNEFEDFDIAVAFTNAMLLSLDVDNHAFAYVYVPSEKRRFVINAERWDDDEEGVTVP